MKAFWCYYFGEDWGAHFHAETINQAKTKFHNESFCLPGEADYIDIRTNRIKEMDNLAFTNENFMIAGIPSDYDDQGDPVFEYSEYINECTCDICKGVK